MSDILDKADLEKIERFVSGEGKRKEEMSGAEVCIKIRRLTVSVKELEKACKVVSNEQGKTSNSYKIVNKELVKRELLLKTMLDMSFVAK